MRHPLKRRPSRYPISLSPVAVLLDRSNRIKVPDRRQVILHKFFTEQTLWATHLSNASANTKKPDTVYSQRGLRKHPSRGIDADGPAVAMSIRAGRNFTRPTLDRKLCQDCYFYHFSMLVLRPQTYEDDHHVPCTLTHLSGIFTHLILFPEWVLCPFAGCTTGLATADSAE
jgi:hypothetical protein